MQNPQSSKQVGRLIESQH